jgi:hypothetical protein
VALSLAAVALTEVLGAWQLRAWTAQAHHCCSFISKRFELVTDEAILDKETGLLWERRPSGNGLPWESARAACAEKIIAAQKKWRLPSLSELRSLVDDSQANPALPAQHPFEGVLNFGFWTKSEYSANVDQAWMISLGDATESPQTKDRRGLAWCIRIAHPPADIPNRAEPDKSVGETTDKAQRRRSAYE